MSQECKYGISVHAFPCWFISQKLSVNVKNKKCELLFIDKPVIHLTDRDQRAEQSNPFKTLA